MEATEFKLSNKPRATIEITLSDGRIITGKRGAPLGKFLELVQEEGEPLIVGGIVDWNLRELTFPIERDTLVTPLSMETEDGARIYRRSLTFLLEVAFKRCFPGANLAIDHSVSSGGYYCQVEGLPEFGSADLELLNKTMLALVKEDVPFIRQTVPLEEAIAYFKKNGEEDKVQLLKYRQRPDLVLYSVGEVRNYHHGYMVPSSGFLKWFDLALVGNAFILRFPQRGTPSMITPMTD